MRNATASTRRARSPSRASHVAEHAPPPVALPHRTKLVARIRTIKPEFATDVVCKRQKDDRYDADPTLGEIDHVVPCCLGGQNTLENLRLLCLRCNRCKGTRHPEALSCAI